MKYSLILMILIVSNIAFANLEISQIFYDAEGADQGFEFIELFNSGTDTEALIDYAIFVDGKSQWAGTCDWCYVNSGSFYIIGEDNKSNYKHDINLPNTKAYIELFKNSEKVDLVGYGESLIYLGSPAKDVDAGYSLLRISNEQNNSKDFIASLPLFRNNMENLISILVLNSIPEIISYSSVKIGDTIIFENEVTDLNGKDDLVSIEIECDNTLNIPYESEVSFECSKNTMKFRIWDKYNSTDWYNLEISPLFEILNINGCSAYPGQVCNLEFDIKANEDLNVELSLSNLYKGSKKINVNSSFTQSLNKGELKNINLEVSIPLEMPSGNYKGELQIKTSLLD